MLEHLSIDMHQINIQFYILLLYSFPLAHYTITNAAKWSEWAFVHRQFHDPHTNGTKIGSVIIFFFFLKCEHNNNDSKWRGNNNAFTNFSNNKYMHIDFQWKFFHVELDLPCGFHAANQPHSEPFIRAGINQWTNDAYWLWIRLIYFLLSSQCIGCAAISKEWKKNANEMVGICVLGPSATNKNVMVANCLTSFPLNGEIILSSFNHLWDFERRCGGRPSNEAKWNLNTTTR